MALGWTLGGQLWDDCNHDLNPPMHDITISTFFVVDPVSTSRFIDSSTELFLLNKVSVEECP